MSKSLRLFCKLSTRKIYTVIQEEMTSLIKVSLATIKNREMKNLNAEHPDHSKKGDISTTGNNHNGIVAGRNAPKFSNDCAIQVATTKLRQGCVIGVPTDTIYGIACLAQHREAIQKVYSIKGRDKQKPLAICVGSTQDIPKWAKVTVPFHLLDHVFPGPVTVVLERAANLNQDLNPGTHLVGIRIPNSEFICKVAQACSEPLALTSANISSQTSTLNVEEFSELWPHLDAVFDGGQLGVCDPERMGSTVVDLSVTGTFKIIRPGCAFEATRDILLCYKLKEISVDS